MKLNKSPKNWVGILSVVSGQCRAAAMRRSRHIVKARHPVIVANKNTVATIINASAVPLLNAKLRSTMPTLTVMAAVANPPTKENCL
jgi:hypothetical protein